MSNTTAIDIVLLPPPDISQWAVDVSRQLNHGQKPLLLLDETHLPHITLVQSFVATDRIGDLYKAVDAIAHTVSPLELQVTQMEVEDNTAGFTIGPVPPLQELYAQLMKITEPFEVEPDPTAFVLDEGETVFPGTMNWVTNFRTFDAYKPHISIAKSFEQLPTIQPRTFVADRLAICHLGNNCTCRKILHEWTLSKK